METPGATNTHNSPQNASHYFAVFRFPSLFFSLQHFTIIALSYFYYYHFASHTWRKSVTKIYFIIDMRDAKMITISYRDMNLNEDKNFIIDRGNIYDDPFRWSSIFFLSQMLFGYFLFFFLKSERHFYWFYHLNLTKYVNSVCRKEFLWQIFRFFPDGLWKKNHILLMFDTESQWQEFKFLKCDEPILSTRPTQNIAKFDKYLWIPKWRLTSKSDPFP